MLLVLVNSLALSRQHFINPDIRKIVDVNIPLCYFVADHYSAVR